MPGKNGYAVRSWPRVFFGNVFFVFIFVFVLSKLYVHRGKVVYSKLVENDSHSLGGKIVRTPGVNHYLPSLLKITVYGFGFGVRWPTVSFTWPSGQSSNRTVTPVLLLVIVLYQYMIS